MIRLSKVSLGMQEYLQVYLTLRSGNIAQGKMVLKFEELFAKYIGNAEANCVAVNSGTSGLYVALLALGVGKGDEVLLPSFSFAATANAVKLVGAEPVFCDIDPDTFTISLEEIKHKITPRTKCIIPVHIFGLPANLPNIYQIAKEHKLLILEDAAQAHGAEIFGNKIGWDADATVYSFYPTKNITSVEGGIIAFRDYKNADFARLFRNQGMREKYVHEIIGMNLRLSDVHASIGVAQVKKLQGLTSLRKRNAEYYTNNLSPYFIRQLRPEGFNHVYHQYVVRIKLRRDEIKNTLANMGIESGVYYPVPIHQLSPYKSGLALPATESLCQEILAIPVHSKLKLSEIKKITRLLNSLVIE
jgi:dTDP-4-amino-4,6-dideoxygalactose transaminase